MSAITISIEPLTSKAFAAYGDVVEVEGHSADPINQGRADRYDALVIVDCEGAGNHPIISMVVARQYDLPKTVTFLERHPYGSQSFIPNSETPFLVVVAAPGETVDESTFKAFVSNGKQGINYHRNTWHHVMLTPFGDVTFIVVDRSDPESNCVEHWYTEEDQPIIDPSRLER
jgi:ureidoglycolate lyase